MSNDNKIVKSNDNQDISIDNDVLLNIAQNAEQRIEAIKKIKQCAIAVTNNNDWIDENGKPYLQASGAEKIARLFSISWEISQPELINDTDGHFIYVVKGVFRLKDSFVEVIGSRSSRDKFFIKYKYNQDGSRIPLPITSINKADIAKAAMTNCIGNGITRLLGIRNMTWDDLHVNRKDVASVRHKSKYVEERIEIKKEDNTNHVKEIQKYFGLLNLSQEQIQKGLETYGVNDVSKLSVKAANEIIEKLKCSYKQITEGEKNEIDKLG